MLPKDAKERKTYPMFTGLLAYFPDALAAVSNVSYVGNEQHNPGEPVHWDRSKSMEQKDTAVRHMVDAITDPFDIDGTMHLAKAAWRILADLQLAIETQTQQARYYDTKPFTVEDTMVDPGARCRKCGHPMSKHHGGGCIVHVNNAPPDYAWEYCPCMVTR